MGGSEPPGAVSLPQLAPGDGGQRRRGARGAVISSGSLRRLDVVRADARLGHPSLGAATGAAAGAPPLPAAALRSNCSAAQPLRLASRSAFKVAMDFCCAASAASRASRANFCAAKSSSSAAKAAAASLTTRNACNLKARSFTAASSAAFSAHAGTRETCLNSSRSACRSAARSSCRFTSTRSRVPAWASNAPAAASYSRSLVSASTSAPRAAARFQLDTAIAAPMLN